MNMEASSATRANLFIVGSMKCGTTILHDFLKEHPEVRTASEKEIHFFTLFRHRGFDWYDAHFEHDEGARWRLDASPSYLDMSSNPAVALDIKAASPGAKVIALIRDPVERAISQFTHLRDIAKEPSLQGMEIAEFFDRDIGTAFTETTDVDLLYRQVLSFSLYRRKLAHFAAVFGKDSFLLLHNDDLRRDGDTVMKQVFRFVGLEPPAGMTFHKQSYLQGTSSRKLTLAQQEQLYQFFADDYVKSCNFQGATRVVPEPGEDIRYYVPTGAIHNEVAVGHDGWLFLAKGSNDVLGYYSQPASFGPSRIGEWGKLLSSRSTNISAQGRRYLHAIVPEKVSVYDNKLALSIDWQKGPGQRTFASLPDDLKANVVNLVPLLRQYRDDRDLFWKTDSHWNFAGAYLSYQMICGRLGAPQQPTILPSPKTRIGWPFDLASKLPDWPQEHGVIVELPSAANPAGWNDLVAFKRENGLDNEPGLHIGSMVTYEASEPTDPRSLLIFGDSYCEYRPHLLTAMLAETFRKVTFVWYTGLDYALVDELDPDIVLTATTERFMRAVPRDNERISDISAAAIDRYLGRNPQLRPERLSA